MDLDNIDFENLNLNVPAGCNPDLPVYASILELMKHDIIDPRGINFTGCVPQCGLCYHGSRDWSYICFNIVVVGIILPIVGCLGLIGNGISAFIYSRPEMRCSTNFYLCALACSDMGVALTGIFLFSSETYRPFSLTVARMSGSLSAIVYPMGMIAQTCSVYFTICAGVDCFVQVCLPKRMSTAFSKPLISRTLAVCVFCFAILYNVPHFFEGFVIDCYHVDLKGLSKEVCPETLRFNEAYQTIYYKYMYAIFLAVGPLVLLIFLNSFIIGFSIFGSNSTGTDDTMSLILVVLLFISCNIIALLINIFEAYLDDILGGKINYLVDLSNFLVVFNSSFNIIIYVKCSEPFANTLKSYFCRRKPKSTGMGPRPPIVITEKPSRSKMCRETLSCLLVASQPEVLI